MEINSLYNEFLLEKRKFERYRVSGPAYAAIGPGFSRMGHIVNISRNGVAFTYIQQSGTPPLETQTVIQISDNNGTLCTLPFHTVSDTNGDLADPHSSVEIRCHRGHFGKLTREQLNTLIHFLENKTDFQTP
jgi:hypothetical protein